MELDAITQAILVYGPAVVSIITMICTVIISIKKVASTSKASIDEVKEMRKANNSLKEDIGALVQENTELKEELHKCISMLNHVDYDAEVENGKK